MADEEKVVQDPEVSSEPQATPDATSVSSPAPESGKEEANNLQSSQEEGTESVEELRQKYSASSKEARLLKEEKEREAARAEQLQQELLATVTKDRTTFESYLDNKGLTPEEKVYYMGIYDKQIAPSREQGETGISQQASEQLQPVSPSSQPANPVREAWMTQKDQEVMVKFQAQQKASEEFFNRQDNQDLHPAARKAIIAQAEYNDMVLGMSPAEALENARKVILTPEQISEEGYVEAVRDSISAPSRAMSGTGGKSKGSAFTLPKKHQAFVDSEIQRRGMNDKEAEEYRRDYALRLARKSE